MANEILITRKAEKQLDRIDSRYIESILTAIDKLADFPNVQADIKPLQGQDGKFRMRVGRYRVIFEVIDGEPKIIEIQLIAKRDERTYTH